MSDEFSELLHYQEVACLVYNLQKN